MRCAVTSAAQRKAGQLPDCTAPPGRGVGLPARRKPARQGTEAHATGPGTFCSPALRDRRAPTGRAGPQRPTADASQGPPGNRAPETPHVARPGTPPPQGSARPRRGNFMARAPVTHPPRTRAPARPPPRSICPPACLRPQLRTEGTTGRPAQPHGPRGRGCVTRMAHLARPAPQTLDPVDGNEKLAAPCGSKRGAMVVGGQKTLRKGA